MDNETWEKLLRVKQQGCHSVLKHPDRKSCCDFYTQNKIKIDL